MGKIVDLSSILKKYKEGWIALSSKGNVVAHAPTLREARQKAQEKDYRAPAFFKSVPRDVLYAG